MNEKEKGAEGRKGEWGRNDQFLVCFLFAKLLKGTSNTTRLKTELIIATKYNNIYIFKNLHLSSTSVLAEIPLTSSYEDLPY